MGSLLPSHFKCSLLTALESSEGRQRQPLPQPDLLSAHTLSHQAVRVKCHNFSLLLVNTISECLPKAKSLRSAGWQKQDIYLTETLVEKFGSSATQLRCFNSCQREIPPYLLPQRALLTDQHQEPQQAAPSPTGTPRGFHSLGCLSSHSISQDCTPSAIKQAHGGQT
ncbi:hypothetical protein Anapl_00427 [Anas platyrhynchos]|uniref:Uncharacterized protein n=1 Tax=Anas platyrhynchos TaxID=8839 RepID=R0JTX6_ANAPL|nr:hypothetical protein Anapl_00427 [Anas platyrhynchos]